MIGNLTGIWYCHGCELIHTTEEHPGIPHHATARAQVGAAVVEVPVYVCNQWQRSVLLRKVASVAADTAQMLRDEMGAD